MCFPTRPWFRAPGWTSPPATLPVGWDKEVLSGAGSSVLLPHFPEPEREVAREWELCLEARPGHLWGVWGGRWLLEVGASIRVLALP